ncbi:MAG: NGG1p interacting factor NIF3 [Patescibacteria group bacterium]|nr:NGG1p interacting factor NIF3 [Patescibacteria group bacterium]
MTTQEIYQLAITTGIKHDLRGKSYVGRSTDKLKKKYEEMSEKEKQSFDLESLNNPYADSRILNSDGKKVIKKVLVGIDIEGTELLYADKRGDIDLVIAHHPEGLALAGLAEVMHLQAEVLAQYGVPINIAESIIQPRISEVTRGISPVNHQRSVDLARLLGLEFMCLHTPADNLSAQFVIEAIKNEGDKLETVGEMMDFLKTIPEYAAAEKMKSGPKIFAGTPERSLGKVVVTEFTGGTSGSKDIYEKMAQYGIGTVIGMHMSEEHRKEAEKYHINVIIAGHMSSDSLGMNLMLDEIEKQGIEVVPISGLIRVKRF